MFKLHATLSLRDRAEQLARSGHFKCLQALMEALTWEGHENVHRGVSGGITRMWLRNLMANAHKRHFDA